MEPQIGIREGWDTARLFVKSQFQWSPRWELGRVSPDQPLARSTFSNGAPDRIREGPRRLTGREAAERVSMEPQMESGEGFVLLTGEMSLKFQWSPRLESGEGETLHFFRIRSLMFQWSPRESGEGVGWRKILVGTSGVSMEPQIGTGKAALGGLDVPKWCAFQWSPR